ncbi:flagellar FliJ family protein [Roseinatronobacter sp.]
MTSKRIKTLTVLERLRRHEMLADAHELATIRSHVAQLNDTRNRMLEELKREAHLVSLEAAAYVGAYIRAVRNEIVQIDKALAQIMPRLDALEAIVADKFRNIKTISLARERAEKHQQHITDKKETAENDMLSLMRHVRKTP